MAEYHQQPYQQTTYYPGYTSNTSTIYQPVPQSAGYASAPAWNNGPAEPAKIEPVVQYTEHHPPQRQDNGPGFFASLKWWWPELLAALVAGLALGAIAFVARHYRGQGVQAVALPTGLSINGLIALLSTIARTALLIPVASTLSQEAWLWLANIQKNKTQLRDLEISDDASRGAWGSVILLTHFRRNWLAHIAAVVTILSLIFGTFTQQLITIKNFPANEKSLNPGNVPWATTWTQWEGRPSEGASSPPLGLKAAAYNGALSGTATPAVAYCPTGNCTWPITPSVAICGGCKKTSYKMDCSASAYCSYTTPSGAIVNLTNVAKGPSQGIGFNVLPSKGYLYPQSDFSQIYVANFEAVGGPPNIYSQGFRNDGSVTATECALWMCVQSFETRTVNANQTTIVRSEFAKVKNYNRSIVDFASNISFDMAAMPSSMNLAPGANYTVSWPAINAFSSFFAKFFNGTVYLNQGQHAATTDVVQALWNSSLAMDPWLRTIASSLTNTIRTLDNATPQNTLYNGKGFQLGYDVRWVWITLPAALVATCLLLLFAIMAKTKGSAVRPWKGSPLIPLFMGLDEGLKGRGRGALAVRVGVKSRIGKERVGVERDWDGGWKVKST